MVSVDPVHRTHGGTVSISWDRAPYPDGASIPISLPVWRHGRGTKRGLGMDDRGTHETRSLTGCGTLIPSNHRDVTVTTRRMPGTGTYTTMRDRVAPFVSITPCICRGRGGNVAKRAYSIEITPDRVFAPWADPTIHIITPIIAPHPRISRSRLDAISLSSTWVERRIPSRSIGALLMDPHPTVIPLRVSYGRGIC